ncbi:MAG: cyclic nucleotide-binding/CBS domain-containing protein [Parasphingorhabdus sp.]
MEIEEILVFLQRVAPFRELPIEVLGQLSRQMQIRYFRSGTAIIDANEFNEHFNIVRSGAVELRIGGTELNHRLGEGMCFGYPSLLRGNRTRNQVVALEDSLIYRLSKKDFLRLHGNYAVLQDFFHSDENLRLRKALETLRASREGGHGQPVLIATVKDLLRRKEVTLGSPDMTVGECAHLMAEADVSTLPVCEDTQLVGIITDKDLRRRALAKRLSYDRPIQDIMTVRPITLKADEQALTAKLIMSRHNIHHLPVVDGQGTILGVLSANDLLTRLGMNTLHVVAEINEATNTESVAQAAQKLEQVIVHLVDSGVDADHIARFVSAIGEAIHKRLLQLAELELGAPPIPYALVVFGSLARQEQAGGSDQDNGFILDNSYDPQIHYNYFQQLAQLLCDGLNGAGYIYCPGDIMATNDKWRQPLSIWKQRYRKWIDSPDPDNVLNTTIFFDMRAIAGTEELVIELRKEVLKWSSANKIFLSFIGRAAAKTRVPLGFFRNFLLEHDEKEGEVLDLKHQAIAPIIDIGRVHALAGGLEKVSTVERLQMAVATRHISESGAADLLDCFEFVRETRFQHQSRQIKLGNQPTNNLDPKTLSGFEREHLKDAFKVIRTHLDSIGRSHAGGIS